MCFREEGRGAAPPMAPSKCRLRTATSFVLISDYPPVPGGAIYDQESGGPTEGHWWLWGLI